jgi:hypothetical protein
MLDTQTLNEMIEATKTATDLIIELYGNNTVSTRAADAKRVVRPVELCYIDSELVLEVLAKLKGVQGDCENELCSIDYQEKMKGEGA